MTIRPATKEDFPVLYEIGKMTPEFQVSVREVFMDADEFEYGISDPYSVFLVAEENSRIIGFIYAGELHYEKPLKKRSACLIYITVLPEFRNQGIAKKLYTNCEDTLRSRGVSGMYSWANTESDIVPFMQKQGFLKGHQYVWMDKEL